MTKVNKEDFFNNSDILCLTDVSRETYNYICDFIKANETRSHIVIYFEGTDERGNIQMGYCNGSIEDLFGFFTACNQLIDKHRRDLNKEAQIE